MTSLYAISDHSLNGYKSSHYSCNPYQTMTEFDINLDKGSRKDSTYQNKAVNDSSQGFELIQKRRCLN